jgi:polyisoprenyl-phosphate glycosyltransferase
MLRFAWTAITSFSGLPLRVCLGGGTLLTCAGIVYMLYVLYATLVKHNTSPGWSSLVCLQTIYSGAILIAIGLVGEYVAKIYEESKGRPLYVVSDALNLPTEEMDPGRAAVLPRRPASETNVARANEAPVEVGSK